MYVCVCAPCVMGSCVYLCEFIWVEGDVSVLNFFSGEGGRQV